MKVAEKEDTGTFWMTVVSLAALLVVILVLLWIQRERFACQETCSGHQDFKWTFTNKCQCLDPVELPVVKEKP